ncbi:MAG: hypothetical protein CMD12_03590 [Flavobacteriales bacterium]|nr:hypothetical protein [Flavobacteriales bacterium]MBK56694.1 hypothetical protein [Flavobacteriaceae bacterium]|tara:strand:- start:1547 stop:1816 length:270 start_codon:yes stop_codon:yes gene_type:complete
MSLTFEIIGMSAAILTTLAFVPQVLKVIKLKKTDGLSLSTYIIFTLGVVLWLVYGFFKNSISMVLGNGITLILSLIILVYIAKGKKSNQ